METLQLQLYALAENRDRFSFPQSSYEHHVILIPQRGSFSYCIDGISAQEDRVSFGEFVYCPGGCVLHRVLLEVSTFHFFEFRATEFLFMPGKHRIADLDRLTSTFRYLHEWDAADPIRRSSTVVEHCIRDLIFLAEHADAQSKRNQTQDIEPLMLHAASLIQQTACMASFSLRGLAVKLSLAPSQLTRRFQAAYSESPIRYATKIRMAKAKPLLIETKLGLDEIAERCGYQSAFYFSRVFSQFMQISPSEFRRTYRV